MDLSQLLPIMEYNGTLRNPLASLAKLSPKLPRDNKGTSAEIWETRCRVEATYNFHKFGSQLVSAGALFGLYGEGYEINVPTSKINLYYNCKTNKRQYYTVLGLVSDLSLPDYAVEHQPQQQNIINFNSPKRQTNIDNWNNNEKKMISYLYGLPIIDTPQNEVIFKIPTCCVDIASIQAPDERSKSLVNYFNNTLVSKLAFTNSELKKYKPDEPVLKQNENNMNFNLSKLSPNYNNLQNNNNYQTSPNTMYGGMINNGNGNGNGNGGCISPLRSNVQGSFQSGGQFNNKATTSSGGYATSSTGVYNNGFLSQQGGGYVPVGNASCSDNSIHSSFGSGLTSGAVFGSSTQTSDVIGTMQMQNGPNSNKYF